MDIQNRPDLGFFEWLMLTIVVGVVCFIAGALVGIERFRKLIDWIKEKISGKSSV